MKKLDAGELAAIKGGEKIIIVDDDQSGVQHSNCFIETTSRRTNMKKLDSKQLQRIKGGDAWNSANNPERFKNGG